MKKVIVIIAGLLIAATAVNAQSLPKPEKSFLITNIGYWMKSPQGFTFKQEELNPVNLVKAIKETKELLATIGANYDSPFNDESVFYDNETESDTKDFYLNARLEYSNLNKSWKGLYNGKEYAVVLMVSKSYITLGYAEKGTVKSPDN